MHRLSAVILALCVVALGSQRASAQLRSQHTFIGDSPSHGQPGWHAGTQGLAHDRNNWYVTNTYNDKTRSLLWRIPVTTNLASDVVCGRGGVSCSDLSDLRLHAYNHYGDPDVYEFNGRVYVLVPLESDDATAPAGIVIFRADETADETLKFLTFTHLTGQAGAPWVAVDGDGIIYSSSFDTQAVINRFYLDWISFQANERVRPTLVPVDPLLLQDKTGKAFDLDKAQGGEFSDDGRRFYLSNGDGRDEAEPSEGLHVFHPPSAISAVLDRATALSPARSSARTTATTLGSHSSFIQAPTSAPPVRNRRDSHSGISMPTVGRRAWEASFT